MTIASGQGIATKQFQYIMPEDTNDLDDWPVLDLGNLTPVGLWIPGTMTSPFAIFYPILDRPGDTNGNEIWVGGSRHEKDLTGLGNTIWVMTSTEIRQLSICHRFKLTSLPGVGEADPREFVVFARAISI